MATEPVFTSVPATGLIQVSAANTNRDGTGTVVTGFEAGVTGTAPTQNGAFISKVLIAATGNTTAGVIRIYYHDGTNRRLIHEELVTAVTPTTTQQIYERTVWLNFWLPDGHKLDFSTHVAETFNISVFAEYL